MADDSKDIEGKEAGGGKKKLILMIAGAVLLVALGGGGVFFLMGNDDSSAAGDKGGAEEQAAAAKTVEEGEPIYVKLDPRFVVNLQPGGPAKMLQIAVSVYTRQQAVADFLSNNEPMFRHQLNNLFEAQSSAELLTLEGKQKLQQSVQDMLNKQLEEMDQPAAVKGVYFTEFVLE